MTVEVEVQLKHPRGSIKAARVIYQEQIDCDGHGFRAWIYMGKGKTTYAEMQTTGRGSNVIRSFFEYGDIQGGLDVGPRYHCNGDIKHRAAINSIEDWKAWLQEYVSGLDPLDHFKFYREAVGGF